MPKQNIINASHGQNCRSITDHNLHTLIDYKSPEAPMPAGNKNHLTARNGMFRRGQKINEWGRIKYTYGDLSTEIDRKLERMRMQNRPIQILDDSKSSTKEPACGGKGTSKVYGLFEFNDKNADCDVNPNRIRQNRFELNKGGDNVPTVTVGNDDSTFIGDFTENGTYGNKFRN